MKMQLAVALFRDIGQRLRLEVSTTVVSSNSTLKPAVTAFPSITFLAQTNI